MGLLSLVTMAINNITTYTPRCAKLKQVNNGVNVILQNTANLVATAIEIAFDPDIRLSIRQGFPIYDTHPSFVEYFNLSQVIQTMCNDLGSGNPTFQSLNCPFLQLPTPPAKREEGKKSRTRSRTRTNQDQIQQETRQRWKSHHQHFSRRRKEAS
jgi:hypothetical protein